MGELVCGADGCDRAGTKLCSRCNTEAYCSAECQRRAWKVHKAVCRPTESPENAVRELMGAGKLHSAQTKLRELPSPSKKLEEELDERMRMGTCSEILGDSLRLGPVGSDMGRGYLATRALQAGEPLLFDTAFASAPIGGSKEPHFVIAEKAMKSMSGDLRRRSAKADARADFYHDRVKALPLKGGMDPAVIQSSALDDEQKEQLMVCSIAEGCSLYCSEEPGHVALFAATAFFNHSCAPNAAIESTRSTLLVRATEDIPEGTEVTISYLPAALLENAEDRRRRLHDGRGFQCRCSRCLREGFGLAEEAPP